MKNPHSNEPPIGAYNESAKHSIIITCENWKSEEDLKNGTPADRSSLRGVL